MKPSQHYFHLTTGEFSWQLSPGKNIKAWGFNDQLPGPEIRVKKGDELVVRVTNNLPEPTMVHWHGIRLPASMDGTGEVQRPIHPGEEFEYRFVVPDAGTFWYHSHYNETEQMEKGMYGSLVVEDDHDPVVDTDRVLMIDDMKLTKDDEFKQHGWFLPRFVERHDGREGDTLLISGKEQPVIDMNAGQTERWRIINASSARYFVMHLGGRLFQIIGTDGGLIESPQIVSEVLVTPGERVDVLIGPFVEGEQFAIEALPYNRTTFLKAKKQVFGSVRVGAEKASKAFIPKHLRTIEPLAPANAEVNRKVKLSVGPSIKRGLDFLVNDQTHVNDKPVFVGELQVWEVENASLMDHPFHLHGFFFQVLEINGKALEYISWKDTVNLTPKTKVKIAWMPDDRPGTWMYHCHILEHHAAGMMANFQVVRHGETYKPLEQHASCH